MLNLRFRALNKSLNRLLKPFEVPGHFSVLYGNNVFSENVMQDYLTKDTFIKWKESVYGGQKISHEILDQIAIAMKDWAISNGATHYTHWFHPLTGATTEKHDAFILPLSSGKAIDRFHGSMLIQQETDASSFPSGGIRNTFQARGYTAWDPSSPVFLIETTLYIPAIFVSYTGEALDYKIPLLRALNAINIAATQVVKYFNKNIQRVNPTLGWEQEYFLVDEALFNQRPDLVFSGRTLLGRAPAKGQQLEDHYFSSIPQRAINFIKEIEVECIRLGIPIATRHNEVAPNQFELASIFEEVNLAVDHNSLLIDVMNRIARKHHFKVLFHEKPFAGINGSGKHNNWSLTTDLGENILAPGKNPKKNLQFLTFFINIIKAVHDYADLLRASVASLGNDHRLGANEAPPAIISVSIGDHLKKILNDIEKVTNKKLPSNEITELKLRIIEKIPSILLDNTDRNRTSPFAFTGNKFEFRAVGASTHCAEPMITLNTIVAKQLRNFKKDVDHLIEVKGMKKNDAILNILREYIKSSKKIIFEGDGYSADWLKEAQKRGLGNYTTTPIAIENEIRKEYIDLFQENGILSKREIKARLEIKFDKYVKLFIIEVQILTDMIHNYILPEAFRYQTQLIENVKGLKEVFGKDFKSLAKNQSDLIAVLSEYFSKINDLLNKIDEEKKKALVHSKISETAKAFSKHISPLLNEIRFQSDALEMITKDTLWPFPKYSELLFIK